MIFHFFWFIIILVFPFLLIFSIPFVRNHGPYHYLLTEMTKINQNLTANINKFFSKFNNTFKPFHLKKNNFFNNFTKSKIYLVYQ